MTKDTIAQIRVASEDEFVRDVDRASKPLVDFCCKYGPEATLSVLEGIETAVKSKIAQAKE